MEKETLCTVKGCLNCPTTESELAKEEVLYMGFGGYTVKKDGKTTYWPHTKDDLKAND